jgi:hypothetical protein
MSKLKMRLIAATPKIIILLLICVIVLQEIRIYMNEQSNGTSVLIFGAAAKVPKEFFLDSKTGSEITLIGNGVNRLFIGNQIDPKTIVYSKAHLVSEEHRCGINIVFSQIKLGHDLIETALLYNTENYIYLVDNKNIKKVTNEIVESICDSQQKHSGANLKITH